eukprot:m.242628 g.242628  ORF g.242628 m.242628 type:complete len:60 (-) comp14074_c0_seq1:232-411(-)
MVSLFARSAARIVPLAFVGGALIELFMIKVQVGTETFYDTALRLEAERAAKRKADEKHD